MENILHCATRNVRLLEKILSLVHGISRVCTDSVGINNAKNRPDTWKTATRFFQTKAIRTTLWKAYDYLLRIDFKIAHLEGSVNTAGDFISRLELKVTEKIRLKIQQDIQTTPIEVTTSSWDVLDEEQFFFTQADSENEWEEKTFKEKTKTGMMQKFGKQVRNHPHWKLASKNLQSSTETLRLISWMKSKQIPESKYSKTITIYAYFPECLRRSRAKRNVFFKMYGKMQCKPTWKAKLTVRKKRL